MGRENQFRERELETGADFRDLERERELESVMKMDMKQRKHMAFTAERRSRGEGNQVC